MSVPKNVLTALKHMQDSLNSMEAANEVLTRGPRKYYVERLQGYVETLFSRYAPFRDGDRAIICKAPNCDNGWASCKQDLVKGAKCTVQGVDYYDGTWWADVILDEETWIDPEGKRQPVREKHTFRLKEEELVKV